MLDYRWFFNIRAWEACHFLNRFSMINLKKEEKEEDSSQSLNLAVNTLYRACMYVCVNITVSTRVIYLHIDIEAFER